MLHPRQFEVNDAWIVFQLNASPIQTDRNGDCACLALMDAASCFMLSLELVPVAESEPIEDEIRQLLAKGWHHKQAFPKALLVPHGLHLAEALSREAERSNIPVVRVPESELLVIIGDARDEFRHQFGA